MSALRAHERQADKSIKPTNPDYNTAIDFNALAALDRDLTDCLVNNHGRLDFKNADHLRSIWDLGCISVQTNTFRCLTKAILKRDFGLQLHLPSNRLCPPVPIRWMYVKWIQDLISSTRPDNSNKEASTVVGLDVGIGSSCIYPLLVCASQSQWRMHGTDVDDTNYQHAVHNVAINEWDDRIKLFHTVTDGPLIPLTTLGIKKLDFTMCNPPFFATKAEAQATFAKDQQPFAACTGADVEMITPGGEVAYVRRMIEESVELRDAVQWCTVQLGKMSSLHALVPVLRDEFSCINWAVSVLQPSGQTVRWVLGWSWMPYRALDEVARHNSLIGTGLQMDPNEILVVETLEDNPEPILLAALKPLPLQINMSPDNDPTHDQGSRARLIFVYTDSAVWSRSARRKRQREQPEDLAVKTDLSSQRIPAHTFLITILLDSDDEDKDLGFSIRARWTKGEDRAVFESFCGMLRAKIRSNGQ